MDLFSALRSMKVLLVDDDEWIRDSLCIYFESEGCRIHAQATAEDGLNTLNRQKFDVIISDYRLPGMDGVEFFQKIRKSHPDAIKILITAYPTNTVSCQAMQAGVQRVIPKPFTSRIILDCLTALTEPSIVHCQKKPLSGIP